VKLNLGSCVLPGGQEDGVHVLVRDLAAVAGAEGENSLDLGAELLKGHG
jgi:hypothetical protein